MCIDVFRAFYGRRTVEQLLLINTQVAAAAATAPSLTYLHRFTAVDSIRKTTEGCQIYVCIIYVYNVEYTPLSLQATFCPSRVLLPPLRAYFL